MEIRCSLKLAVRATALAFCLGAALGGLATGCAAQAPADRGLIIGGASTVAPPAR